MLIFVTCFPLTQRKIWMMLPKPEDYRHPKIAKKIALALKAIENLNDVQKTIQESCKHEIVCHRSYKNGLNPQRICLSCGFEEEGSAYASISFWYKSGKEELGNEIGRTIVPPETLGLNSDNFWSRLRIPYIGLKRRV